ncbi:hypothetical protein HY632_02785 [Candidatus Uhrbacteria bacterium]|nr:hypothetical protein [Candidatus Uhrbacteria bacterium]
MVRTFEQQLRETIAMTLASILDTVRELVQLLPGDFARIHVPGSDRSLPELLRHIAWIPQEEILLLQGKDREAMRGMLGTPIHSLAEFDAALMVSLGAFGDAQQSIDLRASYRNAAGRELVGYVWLLEAVHHVAHHRSQLFIVVRECGVTVPASVLERFFMGHLPIV